MFFSKAPLHPKTRVFCKTQELLVPQPSPDPTEAAASWATCPLKCVNFFLMGVRDSGPVKGTGTAWKVGPTAGRDCWGRLSTILPRVPRNEKGTRFDPTSPPPT